MNVRTQALFARLRGEDVPIPEIEVTTDRRVKPSGLLSARILVIGEAPGAEEAEYGAPFVGKSGKLLRGWARQARVNLNDCRLDNVYPYYPPEGKIKNITADDLEKYASELIDRIAELTDVRVIVPTGNIALKALLGFEGITKHRGSIYNRDGVKVIPIIHPAAVLRGQKQWNRRGHLDWKRIAYEAAHVDNNDASERTHIIYPTKEDIDFYLSFAPHADAMAIDIETKPSEGIITCVGFSIHEKQGLVLEWAVPWQQDIIRRLCATPCDKVFWNHLYDLWYLRREGIEIGGHIYDGMTMMHALQPTDNVALAYATSIYTREPYYKDEIKTEDDKTARENWEQYKEYNSKDACVTRELHDVLQPMLREAGLEEFHHEHYELLAEPMLDCMLQGVCIDHEQRRETLRELRQEAVQTRDALAAKYNDGESLFSLTTKRDKLVWGCLQQGLWTPNEIWKYIVEQGVKYKPEEIITSLETIDAKNISGAKLKKLFYEKYDLPIQLKRRSGGEETETLDIFALRKFRYDYRDDPQIAAMVDLVIDHIKAQKLATFITDNKFDEDGRMRFSLKVTTEAGRLASSTSPRGRKVNSQNIPRDARIRGLVIPDVGHVLLQVDGSAAEARNCFIRTHDPELIRLAGLRSKEYDQHRHTGVVCGFAGDRDDESPENFARVTKVQRQVCKSISHGSQRDMQGNTLAQTILRNGITDEKGELVVYTDEECEKVINLYHGRFPAIRQWHNVVREWVRKDKKLTNSWGRIWPVEYFAPNAELFRKAYSYYLQSDIADWLNTRGFRDCYYWLKKNKMQSRIMLQEHDGLVLSCAPDEAYDVAVFLRDNLEQPWDCDGQEMWVPIEFQLGVRWGQGVEWSELPSREEFEREIF